MTGHTYLMKSRHGVYYLRQVQANGPDRPVAPVRRETRRSLGTKSRAEAKARLVEMLFVRQQTPKEPASPTMMDHDERQAILLRGLTLIEQLGRHDPHDAYSLGYLGDALNAPDLAAYIFAYEHLERQAARRTARAARLVAEEEASWRAPLPAWPELTEPVRAPARPATDDRSHGAGTVSRVAPRDAAIGDATLPDAIARFIQMKTTANAATAEKYRSQCLLFAKILEGGPTKPLSSLTAGDLRTYVDTLLRLPKKISPSDPRPLADILGGPGARMAPKTQSSHARAVHMFLEWCVDQGYPVALPFAGILKPLLKKPKADEKEKSFSPQELQVIFGAPAYRRGLWSSPSDYWLPLLALFTGARQAELCQLHHDDVRRDDKTGIWIFDFNQKSEKKLKQRASRRLVPVHSQLIALGLLATLEAGRARDPVRVFPDLVRNPRGEFNAYSKRFNRFLEGLGITSTADTKKDFHSFRHTLSGYLTERGVEEYVVNTLIGHSQAGRSESVRTYSRGVSLETKRDVIETVIWDLDFNDFAEAPQAGL